MGADTIFGGAGADTIRMEGGADVATGGAGADRFVFEGQIEADTVTDFTFGQDRLVLDEDLWGGGLTRQQVVNQFAGVENGDVVFRFGNGNRVMLEDLISTNALAGDIEFT